MDHNPLSLKYRELLDSYLRGKGEVELYAAQQLSKAMLEQKVSPEELVSYHIAAMRFISPDIPESVLDSFQFLLEMMMGHGVAFREHLSLRNKQEQLAMEIQVASKMQQTLLPSHAPQIDGVDMGVVSIPADDMSGDYYNFVDHGEDSIGIALADIIGKGIPAALCMSMIKYAMDSFYDKYSTPQEILRNLNSVVERNVDSSMFITMMYGIYDCRRHRFIYASAGHEPGLFYHEETGTFVDLAAKGLVLGVSRSAEYSERTVDLQPGDAVILFSDGVTECRIQDDFLDRDRLKALLLKHFDNRAQTIAEAIYQECFHLSNFEQHDDHTMIIIRRQKR